MMAAFSRALVARLACFTLIAGSAAVTATSSPVPDPASRIVAANDNRHPAGKLSQGTLTLALRAGRGIWRPEGPRGPGLSVEALGETSSSLMVPAPLVRVEEGTTIVASIRNDLESSLIVHGFCARDGSECATLAVPPGETRQAQFSAGRPGTYHYWATSMGAPVPFREMAGALVVDPRGGAVAPDRVLVITEWNNLTPDEMRRVVSADDASDVFVKLHPRLTFVLNGLSWPATERLTYRPRRTSALARHQPQLAAAPDAPSRFLFRGREPGRRRARPACSGGRSPPRCHAIDAIRRDHDDGVDAGARRQLALPLSHHESRLAGTPAVSAGGRSPCGPCWSRRVGRHGRNDHRCHHRQETLGGDRS